MLAQRDYANWTGHNSLANANLLAPTQTASQREYRKRLYSNLGLYGKCYYRTSIIWLVFFSSLHQRHLEQASW